MAATVTVVEYNTVLETPTTITTLHMGSLDAASMVAGTANAITANAYAYEKYIKLTVTVNSASTIGNISIWGSADPTPDVILTTAKLTNLAATTYATPVATVSSKATQALIYVTSPGPNVCIGGTLTMTSNGVGQIGPAATGASDYIVLQLKTQTGDTAGKTLTLYIQYDEYA